MERGIRFATVGIAAVGIAAVSTLEVGRFLFARRTKREINSLIGMSRGRTSSIVTEFDLAPLPEPVQRWLRFSQVVGKPIPVAIRVKQQGEFRISEDGAWLPFEAVEYYTTNPPGFVWSVKFRVSRLLSITGRDRYVEGLGDIDMRALSLIPVARKQGGGLNQGAILRYLNEIMWFPAAALSSFISWEPVDATSVTATIENAGESATATFIFDDFGKLIDMVAERYNDSRGGMELWSTPILAYGEFGGIRVPAEGQGIWKYESGDFSYIRLRVTEIDYDSTAAFGSLA